MNYNTESVANYKKLRRIIKSKAKGDGKKIETR